MNNMTMVSKAILVYESHCDFMARSVFSDDGWNYNQGVEIFDAFDCGNNKLATELLIANGWKGECVY